MTDLILPAGRADEGRAVAFLAALPRDRAWRVKVEPWKRTRSHAQNAYLWGVCYRALLEHLPGWDASDVHEYMLGEWAGWEVIEGFGRKRMKPIRRSSRLSTVEFADYVGFIQRKAAELGVFIPDPNAEGL